MTEVNDGYGNPDSPLYSRRQMLEELAAYRRELEYQLDRAGRFGLKVGARARVLKAAEAYAWARARERYANIKESEGPSTAALWLLPETTLLRGKK